MLFLSCRRLEIPVNSETEGGEGWLEMEADDPM